MLNWKKIWKNYSSFLFANFKIPLLIFDNLILISFGFIKFKYWPSIFKYILLILSFSPYKYFLKIKKNLITFDFIFLNTNLKGPSPEKILSFFLLVIPLTEEYVKNSNLWSLIFWVELLKTLSNNSSSFFIVFYILLKYFIIIELYEIKYTYFF